MDSKLFKDDYKIIRDNVHGDIIVENKYLAIINTPEFQRLRRIRQLSIADVVYPGAVHTRLSHSIGTFHIMKLIINHLESELKHLDIPIDQRDKDLAIVSALVHDIGHGPFSHAFENIIPDQDTRKSHEDWTVYIITSKKTKINKEMRSFFDEKFPNDVAKIINKEYESQKDDISFFGILSSLISSQMDADRLDYLVRDSYYTGAKFGYIDIERLISSLKITVYKDKISLYIPEKYLNDIEEYLFSRFQMNKSVYYHPTKVELEEIIKLIFKRAFELYNESKLYFVNKLIEQTFKGELDVVSYCKLDESLFTYAFQEWKHSDDKILAQLCKGYLDRDKFQKIFILDNSLEQIIRFKKDLFKIIHGSNPYHESFLDDKYYWIEKDFSYSMYKKNKENIKILNKMGKLEDFSEISITFNNSNKDLINNHSSKLIFINTKILKLTHKKVNINEIENLINLYDYRNHIEIEQKYYVENESVFIEISDYLKQEFKSKYKELGNITQIDTYYDTMKRDFSLKNETLRIREIGGEKILTFKTPLSNSPKDLIGEQNERIEYEELIEDTDISKYFDFISDKSQLKINLKEEMVVELLRIENTRTKNELDYHGTKLIIYFDNYKYVSCNNNKEFAHCYQIEIELSAEYSKKINLVRFCEELTNVFKDLEKTTESKLLKGLELLERK